MAKAKLNRDYAIRMTGVGIVMLAIALWSLYDGIVAYPKKNRDYAEVRDVLVNSTTNANICVIGISTNNIKDGVISTNDITFVSRMPYITPELWLKPDLIPEQEYREAEGQYLLKYVFAKNGKAMPSHLVQGLKSITKPEGDTPEAVKARAEQAITLFSKDIYSSEKIFFQFVQAVIVFVLASLAFYAVLSKRGKVYIADENGLSGNAVGEAIAWSDIVRVDWSKWEKGIVVLHTKSRKLKLDGWHFAGIRDIAEEIKKNTSDVQS